jgi:hypothetical protein
MFQVLYGTAGVEGEIVLVSGEEHPSTRVLIGDRGWRNYTAKARVSRDNSRSVTMTVYYADEDNLLDLDWGENTLTLSERKNGEERVLASQDSFEAGEAEILMVINDGLVSAYVNGIILAQTIPTTLSRGAVGFGVWDPKGARSTVQSLEVASLE